MFTPPPTPRLRTIPLPVVPTIVYRTSPSPPAQEGHHPPAYSSQQAAPPSYSGVYSAHVDRSAPPPNYNSTIEPLFSSGSAAGTDGNALDLQLYYLQQRSTASMTSTPSTTHSSSSTSFYSFSTSYYSATSGPVGWPTTPTFSNNSDSDSDGMRTPPLYPAMPYPYSTVPRDGSAMNATLQTRTSQGQGTIDPRMFSRGGTGVAGMYRDGREASRDGAGGRGHREGRREEWERGTASSTAERRRREERRRSFSP